MRRGKSRKWSHRPLITIGAATHIASGPASVALNLAGAIATISAHAADVANQTTPDQVFFVSKNTGIGLAHRTTGVFTANSPKIAGTADVVAQLTDPDAIPTHDPFIWEYSGFEDFSAYADLQAYDENSASIGTPDFFGAPIPGLRFYGYPAASLTARGSGLPMMALVPTPFGAAKAFEQLKPGHVTGTGDENNNLALNFIGSTRNAPSSNSSLISLDFRLAFVDPSHTLFMSPSGPGARLKFFEGSLRPNEGRVQLGVDPYPALGGCSNWNYRNTNFTPNHTHACQTRGIRPEDCFNDRGWHHLDFWHAGNTPNPGTVNVLLKTATVHFDQPQAGVLGVGSRIKFINSHAGPPTQSSAADFMIDAINTDSGWAKIRRLPDSGATVSYAGGIDNMDEGTIDPTLVATHELQFSQDQSAYLSPGQYVGGISQLGGFIMSSDFDGIHDPNPTRLTNPGDFLIFGDWNGHPFSSYMDGFLRVAIDGEWVIKLDRESLGITPSDGWKPWCTMEDLTTISTGVLIEQLTLGDNTTWTTLPYHVAFTNINLSHGKLRRNL